MAATPAGIVVTCVVVLAGCGPRPVSPLARAAFDGDVERVQTALATSAPDDAAGGWTPLVWAARRGRVNAMAALLDAGADPNHRDARQGWTPLMHALHKRRRAAARLLLARGANPVRGARGTSPLQMAALDDDVEMIRAVLAARPPRPQVLAAFELSVSGGAFADVDRPLLGACRTAAVRALLEADPSLAGAASQRARWWARWQGCDEVLRLVRG